MPRNDRKKKRIAGSLVLLLVILAVFSCVGCGTKPETEKETSTAEETTADISTEPETVPEKTDIELIGDALLLRGNYGEAANEKIAEIYEEVCEKNPELGQLWSEIDTYWREELPGLEINYDELPYDLSDGENLAIVILGYGLKSDGSMKEELVDRLRVGLYCAWEYPNAYVICTGGGSVPDAKEADVMGQWLLEQGLEEYRLITENKSMTTGQNAINTLEILQNEYPGIDEIAIVTSDYHIPWAQILFKAATMTLKKDTGKDITIVSHAANETGKKVNTDMSKAAGLLEILGDPERAAEIYHKDYSSIPELD